MSNFIAMIAGIILVLYLPYRLITGLIKPQKYNKNNRKDIIIQVLAVWAGVFLITIVLMVIFDKNKSEVTQTQEIKPPQETAVASNTPKTVVASQAVVASKPNEIEPKIQEKSSPKTTKIDYDKVIMPYTKEWTPKLYASWGKDWINQINQMMPKAVDKIAQNPRCDEPDMIELSDNKSIVKKEAVFFVDCKNKERFYISQNDLD